MYVVFLRIEGVLAVEIPYCLDIKASCFEMSEFLF